MASSKVMASPNSTPNSDLTHQLSFPIPPDLHSYQTTTATATTSTAATATAMDDFYNNMYGDSSSHQPHISAAGDVPARGVVGNGMDEVWKDAEMTLEDFLTRAVREDEMRNPAMPSMPALPPPQPPPSQCFGAAVNAGNSMIGGVGIGVGVAAGVAVGNGQFQSSLTVEGFGNGGGVGGLRAKRRAMEEPPVDKATQQKQRRMIKNRESAARSRERKQAYTEELESTAAQLEEENSRLQNEEAQETRERFKRLMESVIPVVEKRKPRRALRRVNSMVW